VASCGEGFGLGVWSGGGFDDTPPSNDVIRSLAQVHLLGKGPGSLSFRSGRLPCCVALAAVLGRLLCYSRLRLLPLYTATVFRCVVFPATTALKIFPRSSASTGEVEAPTRDATGCVSAVTLRMSKALAALEFQRVFWSHVRLHRHS